VSEGHLIHAWSRPPDLGREKFARFARLAERIAEVSGLKLADATGEVEPFYTSDLISFNLPGREKLDGTAVEILRQEFAGTWVNPSNPINSYCETEEGAYDTLVRATLLAFKILFPEAEVENAATPEMWLAAWKLYRRARRLRPLTARERDGYLAHVALGGNPDDDPRPGRRPEQYASGAH